MNNYNVQDCWNYIAVWIQVWKDCKKWEWVNIKCYKNQIKDNSLNDDILLNDV